MPIDKVNPAAAAGAYSNIQKSTLDKGVSGDDGVSFGDILKKTAGSAIDSLKAGEKASAAAITGKADLTDVVQAITQAELTLDTVMAIRDRMIGAYQEIMRMPI